MVEGRRALRACIRTVSRGEAAPRAVLLELEGVPIPTASIDDLIASKRTGRLQDAADIELLLSLRRLLGEAT